MSGVEKSGKFQPKRGSHLKRGRSGKFNEIGQQCRGERGNNLTGVMATASYYTSENQH